MLFAFAVERGVRELLEEDVRLAVDDPVSLLDGGAPERLVAEPGERELGEVIEA